MANTIVHLAITKSIKSVHRYKDKHIPVENYEYSKNCQKHALVILQNVINYAN